jgi:hypothetical protein
MADLAQTSTRDLFAMSAEYGTQQRTAKSFGATSMADAAQARKDQVDAEITRRARSN